MNTPLSPEYDVVVVGGGAAGLSAALVLSRARRRVAVVDAGKPRNGPAAHMHGYLGSDGVPPSTLLTVGRDEIARYGAHLVRGTAAEIAPLDAGQRGFDVTVDDSFNDGQTIRARRVLVTTGLRDELPDIAGARERWGRDLLHCPYCHGYEVRDRALGVLGGTPGAIDHAHLLRQWSDDVVFFAEGDPLAATDRDALEARGVDVVEDLVVRLVTAGDRLSGVELESGRVVPLDAVFFRPVMRSNSALLDRLGCKADENGWVVADGVGRTSVDGVWVAGNAANPRAQVITAAGEGSAAAIAMNADLVDEDVAIAVQKTSTTNVEGTHHV
ncbi:MAG TPA: NAD(P)/FAD-dependent oxidoreductase [Nocardioidaceae bacterium]|nr:NAD(P)/FAD-dependent oxidoreductase [Nocardioidaceae bacterium]